MQDNTLFPYTYEFGVLSETRKTAREFRELALWPDNSEPVMVTSTTSMKEATSWMLTSTL